MRTRKNCVFVPRSWKGYVPVGPFHSREVRLSLEPTLKLHSKLGRFPVNKTEKTLVYFGPKSPHVSGFTLVPRTPLGILETEHALRLPS